MSGNFTTKKEGCCILTMLKPLTASNLIKDFGLETPLARGTVRALYAALANAASKLQQELLASWLGDTGRGEKINARVQAREKRALGELLGRLGLKDRTWQKEFLLISLHTYFTLLVKMLALPLIGGTYPNHGEAGVEAMGEWAAAMEGRGIFRLTDKPNGAASPWYLKVWGPDLARALGRLLEALGAYDFSPDRLPQEDIMQYLYHSLLPPGLRHGLGEFYTPGWLAKYLFSLLEPDIPSLLALGDNGGVLDPTCGSGAFLLQALGALRKGAAAAGMREGELLGVLPRLVVGVDRNPLAVLTARVNYLFAIADLLPLLPESFVAPVYLADTLLAPPPQLEGSSFNYIIGNPPWINWETLPVSYRRETHSLWEKYGLYQHKGYDALLGKSKDDLAVLMTYVVLHRYLAPGGRLAFVITQSIFKTTGAGQGFRSFVLPGGVPVKVVQVEDLSALKPFPGAKNRTALMVLDKGKPTTYPVPYIHWQPRPGAGSPRPDGSLRDVKRSTQRLALLGQPVDPTKATSPWLTACPKALEALEKIIGPSPYRAREGVNTGGANGVFYLHLLKEDAEDSKRVVAKNLTTGIKRPVPQVKVCLEGELIYPLLRGRDIKPWLGEPQAYILLTHRAGEKLRAIPAGELKSKYPHVAQYLDGFASILGQRRTRVVRNLMAAGPFYSIFALGDYTFAPYKVVWQRIGRKLTAAVVSRKKTPFPVQKMVIPNDSTVFVPFEEAGEAHYFCALLNSTPAQFVIRSTSVLATGSFASPHILEKIAIPQYNPHKSLHRDLASLGQRAAILASQGGDGRGLEEEMDILASRLWSLTRAERRQVQLSLQQYRD